MPHGDDEDMLRELRDAAAAFLAIADVEWELDDPTSRLHATADRLEDILLRVRAVLGD